jgi:hypothetical protein
MVNIHINQRLRDKEMHILKGFSRLKFKFLKNRWMKQGQVFGVGGGSI